MDKQETVKTSQRNMETCGEECEVYSRVCGYFRPVANWNRGKVEEFKERKPFEVHVGKTC